MNVEVNFEMYKSGMIYPEVNTEDDTPHPVIVRNMKR